VDATRTVSNDHGRWYRSDTTVGDFPNGFGTPQVVLEDAEAGRLFEACNVYKVQGTNEYLALIEAFNQTSEDHPFRGSWGWPRQRREGIAIALLGKVSGVRERAERTVRGDRRDA
jgi:hypothetical protein